MSDDYQKFIEEDIEEDLGELVPVSPCRREIGSEIGDDLHVPRPRIEADQIEARLNDPV